MWFRSFLCSSIAIFLPINRRPIAATTSAKRCGARSKTGKAISEVAIIASGGLSHFVIDEDLDGQVLRGIQEKRSDLLKSIPTRELNSGSSETRNWIAAVGALEDFVPTILDYVPSYRSPAGTGCGMGFARWDPSA